MDNLWTSLYPVYILSKIFGQVNFNIISSGKDKILVDNKYLKLYCLVFHSVLTIFSLILFNYREKFFHDEFNKQLIRFLYMNTSICLTLSSAILHLVTVKTHIQGLNTLMKIDEEMKKMGIFIDHKRLRNYILKLIIFQYIIMIFYHIMNYDLFIHYDYNNSVFMHYVTIMLRKNARLINTIQVTSMYILIKERYKLLRINLSQVAQSKYSNLLGMVLMKTAQLHHGLCSITRTLNYIYGVSSLMSISLTSVNLIMDLYEISTMYLSDSYGSTALLKSLYSTFCNLTHFVIGIYVCKVVSEEVIKIFYNSK